MSNAAAPRYRRIYRLLGALAQPAYASCPRAQRRAPRKGASPLTTLTRTPTPSIPLQFCPCGPNLGSLVAFDADTIVAVWETTPRSDPACASDGSDWTCSSTFVCVPPFFTKCTLVPCYFGSSQHGQRGQVKRLESSAAWHHNVEIRRRSNL
ncbi:hypothetical protein NX059_004999 [Plenodomus lindquistii]|nr:hypothetical protein NX059_004999 [Plenodomus lindquistii]